MRSREPRQYSTISSYVIASTFLAFFPPRRPVVVGRRAASASHLGRAWHARALDRGGTEALAVCSAQQSCNARYLAAEGGAEAHREVRHRDAIFVTAAVQGISRRTARVSSAPRGVGDQAAPIAFVNASFRVRRPCETLSSNPY